MTDPLAPKATANTSTLSLRSIAALLFRRKFLIASVFAALFGAVCLITLLMPRQYESRMKVLVKNERADLVVSPDASNSSAAPHGDVSDSQVNSETELLTSKQPTRP